MDIPPGGELSVLELLKALRWKLKTEDSIPSFYGQVLSYEREAEDISRLIRRQYNARQAINTLPSEILALVFSFVSWSPRHELASNIFPPLLDQEQTRFSLNSWICWTAHVCSHWRQVSLSEPILWSHLFFPRMAYKPDIYGTSFLQRCGPIVPLHVSWNLDRFVFDYKTRSIQPSAFFQRLKDKHSHQLTTFNIQGTWNFREQLWALLEDFHAPNLQSLTLDLSPWNFSSSSDAPRYLPRVFGGTEGLPSLKRLALKEVVGWPENRFRNLTHLSLEQQDRDFRPPMDEFLDILSLHPALEHLRLVNAGPIVPRHPSTGRQKTTLPKLRQFEMGEFDLSFDRPHHFLAQLELPRNCIVHLWSDSLFRLDNAPSEVLPHFMGGQLDETGIDTAVVRCGASRNMDTLVFDGNTIHIDTPAPIEYVFYRSRNLLSQATRMFLHLSLLRPEVLAAILTSARAPRELTFTMAFNYIPALTWIREAEHGELLERVTFAGMSPATRLKAAERALAKELESKGSITVDRNRFPPCSVFLDTVEAPRNPALRRPLQSYA